MREAASRQADGLQPWESESDLHNQVSAPKLKLRHTNQLQVVVENWQLPHGRDKSLTYMHVTSMYSNITMTGQERKWQIYCLCNSQTDERALNGRGGSQTPFPSGKFQLLHGGTSHTHRSRITPLLIGYFKRRSLAVAPLQRGLTGRKRRKRKSCGLNRGSCDRHSGPSWLVAQSQQLTVDPKVSSQKRICLATPILILQKSK